MNKNKLSRFLLSASAGIIATLSVSEVKALTQAEIAADQQVTAIQAEAIRVHTAAAIAHFKGKGRSDSEAASFASSLALSPSGLSALRSLGDGNTTELYDHFHDILAGGIELTPEHFDSFLAGIADIQTLKQLGVADVRQLHSPELERQVVPSEISSPEEAVYFAEQRKHAGEFKAAAEFFLKAREKTADTNTTLRTEYAEKALLMYSEHFIHHVARVTSVTEKNVSDAQALLAEVKALAEATNTSVALVRAAGCAKELGTAIHDLARAKAVERAALEAATTVDTAAVTAAKTKVASLYVALYNADVVARDMHEKAADLQSGENAGGKKNDQLVAAANSMRLAIGALADAMVELPTAAFSGDITVAVKLKEEALAFNAKYTALSDMADVNSERQLKATAASQNILLAKLKATWNARARYATGSAEYIELNTQYAAISAAMETTLTTANTFYNNIAAADQYLSAAAITSVRFANAERLYRLVLDADNAGLPAAVTVLNTYVTTNGSIQIVNGLDTSLKAELSESKAEKIRHARRDANKMLGAERALVARAMALQLEKLDAATLADRATRLEAYLTVARQASNKTAWAAGAKAADVLLADAAVAAAADDAYLVKVLALTVKSEALLKNNTSADDAVVATVDADNALDDGLLSDAAAAAALITDGGRALRVRARNELRKAFETAVELHNSMAVKQGLRTAWATVENAYAIDEVTLADTALTVNTQLGNGDFITQILLQLGPNATVADVKTDLEAWTAGAGAAGAAIAGTLSNYFDALVAAGGAGVDGVTYASLDTVEKLYNHLVAKFAEIRAASADIYQKYDAAAKAFEKARMAKADWAAQEVTDLASATAATFVAKRTAAAAAHTEAAGYEFQRMRAMLANAGRGLFVDAAFDALDEVNGILAANNGRLAAYYVNEDILTSLHRRMVNLKAAASAYSQVRPAVGDDALIAADVANTDAQIDLIVHGGNIGALEVGVGLVNVAFQGLAQYNAAATFGTLVSERLTALSHAYRKVNALWMIELTSSLALTDVATSGAHRDAVHGWLQDGAAIDAGADLAGRIFALDALFAAGGAGGNYAETQQLRRDLALAYEAVLRSVVELDEGATITVAAVGADNLNTRQSVLYDEVVIQANLASAIALTAFNPAEADKAIQFDAVIAQLTERANASSALAAAAYAGTRSANPSDVTVDYVTARGQNIDAMARLVDAESAQDLADRVLSEQDATVATVNRKTKVYHQLGRVYTNKGKAEGMRFDNAAVTAHRDVARVAYLKAVDAYKTEITLLLGATTTDNIADRNARLIEAYENLAEAYKFANQYSAASDPSLLKGHAEALFNRAEILYRDGSRIASEALLNELERTMDAAAVKDRVLHELAEQYEAAGSFSKAAHAYNLAALQDVAKKEVSDAFRTAEKAYAAADQTGQTEACEYAAGAFNAIGAEVAFHGRVRAEAYHRAAGAYVLGGLYVKAAGAYASSAEQWAKIGDHMQAGNQYEKAAWALSKVSSITADQRIQVIGYVADAAHQLQIADATQRLEKLVDVAEAQFAKLSDAVTLAEEKKAVVVLAKALYEKALAFQKEGNLKHAEASEARLAEIIGKVDAGEQTALAKEHLAGLYALQGKHEKAVTEYVAAAEHFVTAKKLLAAAKAYRKAADAALSAKEGNRIAEEILPALVAISASVRTGGANAGRADQFDIHLEVVEAYKELAALHPKEVDKALAELAEVKKEAPSDNAVKARLAALEISLLSRKARSSRSQAEKLALLATSQSLLDGAKVLVGVSSSINLKVQNAIALAAQELVEMYVHVRAIHSATDSLAQLKALETAAKVAETSAQTAYEIASQKLFNGYDVALEAAKRASVAMSKYAQALLHFVVTEKDKARADDMVTVRGLPTRMVKFVENALRSTLLGILKSRAEAAAIRKNFVAVMNQFNRVNAQVAALRRHEAARDAHGDAVKAKSLKETMAATHASVKGAVGDIATQSKDAHAITSPVERAQATDVLVKAKTDAVVAATMTGIAAHADLVKSAPAAEVQTETLVASTEAITKVVVGDGKTKGLVGDLHDAQTGPSTAAQAVVTTR
ncbi:MAG: hypothetical protein H6492_01605 [Candidatus Paracaedibacteraceae bacterium]|nr:hypothetical protein [Candidatus Paracaedibacteraceae bacterium]